MVQVGGLCAVSLARPSALTGAAIQTAIDAVEAAGGGAVDLRPASYALTAPLRIHESNMELVGTSGRANLATSNSFYGPMLHIGPDRTADLPLAAALLGGSGNSIQIGPSMTGVLDLRQGAGLDLNGATSLCVEFSIRPDSLTDFRQICGSFGIRRSGETAAQGISLSHSSGGALSLSFKCGGVTHSLAAPSSSLAINTTAIVCFDYDGSTIRLFVDGALVDSEAATGGINMEAHEGFFLGAVPSAWPDGGAVWSDGLAARIDAFRVSNSRRTSAYTAPTTKGSYGDFGAIRCELLCTESHEDFIVGRMLGATLYLRHRAAATPENSDVRVANIGFLGGVANGIEAEATVRLVLDDINTPLSACRDCIRLRENCFNSRLTKIAMTGSGIGVSFAGACGVSSIRDSDVASGTYGLVAISSGLRVDNIYLSGAANWSAWFRGGGGSTTTIDCSFMVTTDEGRGSAPEGGVFVSEVPISNMAGCIVDVATFDTSAIGIQDSLIVASGLHIKQKSGGTAATVKDESAPALSAGSVRSTQAYRWEAGRSWSNTASLVTEL